MSQKIFQVNDVELVILESFPPQLMITASGLASTSGWTNPELKLADTDPTDGIYEYEFVATPPTGIALQVLTPIIASKHLGEIPEDFKGVKVHASSNSEEQNIGTQRSSILENQNTPLRQRRLERLLGFRLTDDSLFVRVKSGGCTKKEHFHVEINSGFTGMSPVFASIYRVMPDHCKASIPGGIEIEFTFEELGLQEDTDILIVNPVGKKPGSPDPFPPINIPPHFPPMPPIPTPPFPWPVNPPPQPWPWPWPLPGPRPMPPGWDPNNPFDPRNPFGPAGPRSGNPMDDFGGNSFNSGM